MKKKNAVWNSIEDKTADYRHLGGNGFCSEVICNVPIRPIMSAWRREPGWGHCWRLALSVRFLRGLNCDLQLVPCRSNSSLEHLQNCFPKWGCFYYFALILWSWTGSWSDSLPGVGSIILRCVTSSLFFFQMALMIALQLIAHTIDLGDLAQNPSPRVAVQECGV